MAVLYEFKGTCEKKSCADCKVTKVTMKPGVAMSISLIRKYIYGDPFDYAQVLNRIFPAEPMSLADSMQQYLDNIACM